MFWGLRHTRGWESWDCAARRKETHGETLSVCVEITGGEGGEAAAKLLWQDKGQ